MTKFMTQTEYADHRGISQPRISKMIKIGKIPPAAMEKISGKNLIDVEKADAALERNLDRVKNKPTRTYGKNKKARESVPIDEQKKILTEAGVEMRSLADAQTVKENYTAYLKELEYKTKISELLPADDVERMIANLVMTARGKILGIKAKLAPLLKEFVDDPGNFGLLLESVEEVTREVLQDIADASAKING